MGQVCGPGGAFWIPGAVSSKLDLARLWRFRRLEALEQMIEDADGALER